MRRNTTSGQISGRARRLAVSIMLCLLSACSVVPKTVAVSEDTVSIQADECSEASENCKSTMGERYHYYLGLLSVYLIGL